MPVVMQKNKIFSQPVRARRERTSSSIRNTSRCCRPVRTPRPRSPRASSQPALAQNPKPTTVALAAEDAEFSRNACEGARKNAKKFNLKIVYDKTYPPATTDFAPIVRALQAANPDIVIICSYPLSSVGMVQTVNELNYKPKMIGGAMVGLQATVFKQRLGAKLNGIVNYETWVPTDKMMAPAAEVLQEVPGERRRRRRRSARLLSRRLGLRLYQHARRGDRGDQERRRRQDRRLAAQDRPSRPSWATGATARRASGPSPA